MNGGEVVEEGTIIQAGREVELRQASAVAVQNELSIQDLVHQVTKIQEAMKAVMKDGEHYGVIPGTGTKPTLLKPGAEKLCLLFRFGPEYTVVETRDGDHYTAQVTCTLLHIPTGNRVGSGMGLCSSKEAKYAYRKGGRVCPSCGKDAIIKGKEEYGGGWLCFKKKDGCGAKYADGDLTIESQSEERKDNEDLADTYNTVLKMGCKRALVAAVLNATAASDIFTQDIEDLTTAAPTTPVTRVTVSEPEKVSPETLEALEKSLELVKEQPNWAINNVLKNAGRVFGRTIPSLADLSDSEALQIISGARSAAEQEES